MSNENIFLILLLAIAIGYLIWIIFKMMKSTYCGKVKEHFTETEEEVTEENLNKEEYSSKLDVMKVFETVLHRKATLEELEKYSKFSNEQDILVEVLKDFKVPTETEEEFVIKEAPPEKDNDTILEKLDSISATVESIKKMLK